MEDMEIKGKKILVTGGAGFIGSHLVEELVNQGARVSVIDIKIDKRSLFFINNLKKKINFRFLDIRDEVKVKKYLNNNSPEYIFHLAAEPIVEKAYDNPLNTFKTNIMGTINLLENVRNNKKIKGIIVASTDKAYGKTNSAYNESSPLKGDHPYDVSKSSMDLICQTYYKTYGLSVVITRFGNVYGEGDFNSSRIIPGICDAIINKKVLKIRSNGKYIRDYLYVKDVVDGYIFLLKKFEKIKGEAFNFSSKDTLSVIQLIKKAEEVLKIKVKFVIQNTAKNEIPYQHLDDKKIRKLGWKNNHSVKGVLIDVLEWYKN